MKKFFLIFVFLYTANLNADQALYGSFFGNDNWAAGTYKISSDGNEVDLFLEDYIVIDVSPDSTLLLCISAADMSNNALDSIAIYDFDSIRVINSLGRLNMNARFLYDNSILFEENICAGNWDGWVCDSAETNLKRYYSYNNMVFDIANRTNSIHQSHRTGHRPASYILSTDKTKIIHTKIDTGDGSLSIYDLQINQSLNIQTTLTDINNVYWAGDDNIYALFPDTSENNNTNQLFKVEIDSDSTILTMLTNFDNEEYYRMVSSEYGWYSQIQPGQQKIILYDYILHGGSSGGWGPSFDFDSTSFTVKAYDIQQDVVLTLLEDVYTGWGILLQPAWSYDGFKLSLPFYSQLPDGETFISSDIRNFNFLTNEEWTIQLPEEAGILYCLKWFKNQVDDSSTIYVSNDGSDEEGDGSVSNPYFSIQKAIDESLGGETVQIANGTYIENIQWSSTQGISLIGSSMDSTIIDGGGVGKVIDNSDDTSHPIEISNLTIQNGFTTGKGGGISLKMTGDIILKNIRVNNNQANYGGGIHIEGTGTVSFVQTIVHIENAIISNNSATSSDGGIDLYGDFISSIIKNSTIVNNSSVNGGGGLDAGSPGNYAIIVNSIFWNNQPANTDGIVIPYFSNIDIPIGTNNIFTDPLFIDDDNDFHLSNGSPCIDSGTDFLIADLSGQMLPGVLPDTIINLDDISYFGHSPDMGVYESNYNLDYECIAEDSTEGIELWGQCYSIENTTSLGWPPFIPDSATVVPLELFNLVNLTSLSINYTNVGGIIPPEIGNLTNLIKLNLSSNQFSGSIPSEIGNLTNLTSLNLSSNQFSGDIPIEVFNLLNLEGGIEPALMGTVFYPGLDLSDNSLSGIIPEQIASFEKISSIDLSNNQLTGSLPVGLYSLDSLQSLNLSNNSLTGEISAEIGNLSSLEGITTYAHNSVTQYDALNLSNNLLTGIIPSEICDLPLDWGDSYMNEYQGFSISNNQFCSPFPYCLEGFIGSQDTSNCVQMKNQNVEIAPIKYSLSQNHPNPFNPITSLRYDLPNDGLVNITIYDMMGRIVKTLVNGSQTAGFKSVQWNATNDRNEPVSAGLYLCKIQAGELRQTKKMVLLK